MKRLDELDYIPTEWALHLEEALWITTAGDLLSSCRTPGGLERLARTLETDTATLEGIAAQLTEELGEGYDADPIDPPGMGLLPPEGDEETEEETP